MQKFTAQRNSTLVVVVASGCPANENHYLSSGHDLSLMARFSRMREHSRVRLLILTSDADSEPFSPRRVSMLNTSKDTNITASVKGRVAVIGIAVALSALSASAQTAKDIKGATPLVAIQNEAPAQLIVDPPIPGPGRHSVSNGKPAHSSRVRQGRVGSVTTRWSPALFLGRPILAHGRYKRRDGGLRGSAARPAQSTPRIGGPDSQADPGLQQGGGVHSSRSPAEITPREK
jgi:hypothetical protein